MGILSFLSDAFTEEMEKLKKSNTSDPFAEAAKQVKKSPTPRPHEHPGKQVKNVVVEKKKAYYGSLGDVRDEGCKTHGDDRYVIKAPPIPHYVKTISPKKMSEALILSEILGKPKSKR